MRNYRVSFFRVEKEQNEQGKMEKTSESYLGSVVVDDHGTDNTFTVTAKAFRHAPATFIHADKVKVEEMGRNES